MDELIAAASRDPKPAVEDALEVVAEVTAEELRQTWPSKTGRSAAAWRAEGSSVRNDRPETSHIRDGLVGRMVPPLIEGNVEVFDAELQKRLGLD